MIRCFEIRLAVALVIGCFCGAANLHAQSGLSHAPPAREGSRSRCRVVGGLLGGGAGFLLGGFIGYRAERTIFDSSSEDPGLTGLLVGSVAGAVVGAMIGVGSCNEDADNHLPLRLHEQLWLVQDSIDPEHGREPRQSAVQLRPLERPMSFRYSW
jgi:hypothetical protein